MKALGAEIKEFYTNGFPKDCYHDDYDEELVKVDSANDDDNFKFDDDEMVDLSRLGVIISNGTDEVTDFEKAFKRWKKLRTERTLYVTVSTGEADRVIAQIKALGYKVK